METFRAKDPVPGPKLLHNCIQQAKNGLFWALFLVKFVVKFVVNGVFAMLNLGSGVRFAQIDGETCALAVQTLYKYDKLHQNCDHEQNSSEVFH